VTKITKRETIEG
jgi:hypothetical protein